jgi:hypothetical protein
MAIPLKGISLIIGLFNKGLPHFKIQQPFLFSIGIYIVSDYFWQSKNLRGR